MKKVFIIACISITVSSCSHKTIASKTGTATAAVKSPATVGEAPKPSPNNMAAPVAADLPRDTVEAVAATPEMIATGQKVFEANCANCHTLKIPGNYTASLWERIVDRMAPKARLSDTEKANVLAYLKVNSKQG